MFEEIIGDEKIRRQREAVAQKQVFEAHRAEVVPLVTKIEGGQEAFEIVKPSAVKLLDEIKKCPQRVQDYCAQYTNELRGQIFGLGGAHAGLAEALAQAKQNLLNLRAEDFGGNIYGRGWTRAQGVMDEARHVHSNVDRIRELLELIDAAAKRAGEAIKWTDGHGAQRVEILRTPNREQPADRTSDDSFNLLGS